MEDDKSVTERKEKGGFAALSSPSSNEESVSGDFATTDAMDASIPQDAGKHTANEERSEKDDMDVDVEQRNTMDPQKATAKFKILNRANQKLYEKTKGNRHEEVKKFVTNAFAESHLQQIIKDELVKIAVSQVKINNIIGQNQRVLKKFEDAIIANPDLPFIPNSASNLTLTASESVRAANKFEEISLQVEEAKQIFNKK